MWIYFIRNVLFTYFFCGIVIGPWSYSNHHTYENIESEVPATVKVIYFWVLSSRSLVPEGWGGDGLAVHRRQQMPGQRLVTDELEMSVKLNRQSPTTLTGWRRIGSHYWRRPRQQEIGQMSVKSSLIRPETTFRSAPRVTNDGQKQW